MKIRKSYLFTLIVLLSGYGLMAQKLTLEQCLSKAEEINPLSRQKLHYETLEELTKKNISNAYLPAIFINGQVSYQSDVSLFPIAQYSIARLSQKINSG